MIIYRFISFLYLTKLNKRKYHTDSTMKVFVWVLIGIIIIMSYFNSFCHVEVNALQASRKPATRGES